MRLLVVRLHLPSPLLPFSAIYAAVCGLFLLFVDVIHYQVPSSPGERVGIGFGGKPDPSYGMAGENYVGFNAMIARAERIAARAVLL